MLVGKQAKQQGEAKQQNSPPLRRAPMKIDANTFVLFVCSCILFLCFSDFQTQRLSFEQ